MKQKLTYTIRNIDSSEIHVLNNFLYEAIFQEDMDNPLPKDVITTPELQVYIKDFGKETDYCLVAEYEKDIVGCVWTRILAGEIKGYGYIDENTPEFAISVLKNYRGYGIGTSLMQAMLKLLQAEGYKKTSLAVQKENYAYKMYEKIGFKIVREHEEEFLMVYDLNKTAII